jgi:hypothetical protein
MSTPRDGGSGTGPGTSKPDTRGYPSGACAGKVFRPQEALRAGKSRQHGYTRGRVNTLPALTRPVAIPKRQTRCHP